MTNLKSANIVVFGAINMDLIGLSTRLPLPGETVKGESFYTSPGGKGANQAVAAARLGGAVKMFGRVGNDLFGQDLIRNLSENQVNVDGIARDKNNSSGIAMILLDSTRQNHILAIYGANLSCNEEQIQALESTLKETDVLLLQSEIPVDVSLDAARAAKSQEVLVIWDPAPPSKIPTEAYEFIDILTPNQSEAEFLTGIPVNDVTSADAAASVLLEFGTKTVVIKMGDLGTFYASQHNKGHIMPYKVTAIDSIAAGDAFGGALAIALAKGNPIDKAMKFGAASGALAVTKKGAQTAMPFLEEVKNLMSSSEF